MQSFIAVLRISVEPGPSSGKLVKVAFFAQNEPLVSVASLLVSELFWSLVGDVAVDAVTARVSAWTGGGSVVFQVCGLALNATVAVFGAHAVAVFMTALRR